ncbi:HNH endonuclease [Chryseobacterium sp. CFBP8996]|uniref:HNH endonuclease n=1 Tax=Chryseobacterium sp. CFBP8996 TaxID=3096529 RepID=UPI002A69F163|nr:HNH endonuclease [Chryseobacterium sp. CFBP8996]MDY0931620.1 HNH endonuclease [Chryseobacterium sp. CFBP8996]
MKNLNSYTEDTCVFLDHIINAKKFSKKDPDYKVRLNPLIPNVKICYRKYLSAHNSNNHLTLISCSYIDQNKNDLLKLYSPQNKKLIDFKNSRTTVYDNRVKKTCQYCTINSANTLDHIIPKEEYSEFAVNPLNLIPACSECNGYKGEYWRDGGRRLFLNLYTDILPDEQYLFVDFIFGTDVIETKFNLDNKNKIDINLFNLISSHFSRMHLLSRFSIKSSDIISELTNLIVSSKPKLSQEDIREVILNKVQKDKDIFGNNYYKSVLEESLVNSGDYMKMFFP